MKSLLNNPIMLLVMFFTTTILSAYIVTSDTTSIYLKLVAFTISMVITIMFLHIYIVPKNVHGNNS